jgi:hypothetical protein
LRVKALGGSGDVSNGEMCFIYLVSNMNECDSQPLHLPNGS